MYIVYAWETNWRHNNSVPAHFLEWLEDQAPGWKSPTTSYMLIPGTLED